MTLILDHSAIWLIGMAKQCYSSLLRLNLHNHFFGMAAIPFFCNGHVYKSSKCLIILAKIKHKILQLILSSINQNSIQIQGLSEFYMCEHILWFQNQLFILLNQIMHQKRGEIRYYFTNYYNQMISIHLVWIQSFPAMI